MSVEPVTLADVIPEAQFRECHERVIAAPPAVVWAALHELRLIDLPLSRALMDLRALPGRVVGRDPSPRATGRLLEDSPVPLLASVPERAIVAGGLLQPWKPLGGASPPQLDAAGLRTFTDPGWVKAALSFVLEPEAGSTRLRTETRVTATDPASRRRFAAYWLLIRAGSGLIRRDILRGVARRAEASSLAPRPRWSSPGM